MKTITEFPRKVVEFPDMGIVMPDGCRLSARVWMPEDAGDDPVPVILEHLPYRKRDGTIFRDQLTHPYFAGHGYASIRVDMRGNGDSEGLMDDEYSEQELQDACDVIAWAAAQPWCNGNVGMMGISWGGFNCLQVAAKQPPALKAVISLCSTVDRYADDIHYKGGCLLNENFGWASTMLSYSSRPPDPLIAGDNRWRDLWLRRLENQSFLLPLWLSHQHRDAYWKRGSICEDFSAIKAAVLSIGGWHDGYRNTISHLVTNIEAPVKGIVGPWIHKYPHYAGPKPAIGFLQEALRWWDHWLKGAETGVEADPDYRAYVMDSVRPARWHPERPGRWIAEQEWPSSNITIETIELVSADAGPSIVASPQTCGLAGGEYFPFTFGPELPGDQRPDDGLSACFDQPELTKPIEIVGAPELEIQFASDRPQANIAVRLCDVHPDGASELISYGVLNLTHRKSHEFPEALVPGETVSARVVLDQCAYRVPAGHRLRVAVSTAYWPAIWPSPEPVRLTLSAASLSVPLRLLATGDEVVFGEPEGATPWATETVRPAKSERHVDRDEKTGIVTLSIADDFGEVRDLDHGLVNGSIARETWTIHPDDPLSASGKTHWTQTLSRNGWSVRTETWAQMRSDAQNFIVSARIEAYEGENLVFERDFDERVPRALV
ncbi:MULTISPECIES: CocE/NonD family hydrolase [unclassified Mesorhizobium]|uniref:CocE/NonD family hydrolase n=1 Tax=unclassified Mesorhizobium TaxID=325217 RepID=UPI001091E3F6|nr:MULTISPECIES: CocE/NonD family hydrolase [unclassified Mesorhizobium]TGQ01863.1 CocE/NonD family hydrolase [Mesorhizobium sp. M8A.F.Ca.ET.218.01.1.1]TGQ85149.1 CocE/NonD family hydrolase [Mesorhizobium sp. M8A.F.Ca.ET.208.01.1.1]TGS41070.1 CocE/NonD family hydrolase [Mesorhizobium sp. M8A.F.Ca.ET.182.01.1.1]TGS79182.1 CocE/NonD family hydrolase [Mesorhizobium sp. M8A.F.Ca.ET.181.01.1.1]TGT21135.1 CocE/NonD family hydrolase [Mesorhizobium sp. M8A.F.Ca.ET.213.01.1.1]